MSTSVASAAPWSRQSTGSPGTDTTSISRSRAKRAAPTKLANGNDAAPKKSLSPVPSSSTRSTRSRKNVSYDESNSPEFNEEPLPPMNSTYKPLPSKRKSPGNGSLKHANGFPSSSAKVATSTSPRKSRSMSPRRAADTDIDEVIVARRSETSSPTLTVPDSKAITPDPEPVKAELPLSVQKIKLSYTPKRPASEEPEGASEYDDTPRVSPAPEDTQLNAYGGGDDTGPQAGDAKADAPRRAPRKKRKWLKKGEVDPDDPVAVAKQKERFILLDKADELLAEQMDAVNDGTHPAILELWEELGTRRDRLLAQCQLRNIGIEEEINKFRQHGTAQARVNHAEDNEKILEEKRKGLNRLRHQLKFEKAEHLKRGRYPVLREGRGSGGWPVHTKNLYSNGNERLIAFEIDGELCHRRDSPLVPDSLTKAEAKADLALFKSLRDRRRVHTGSSGAGSSSRSARPSTEGKVDAVPALKPYPPIPTSIQQSRVPLRQTPNHSPSSTPAPPSRRPSPLPAAQASASTSSALPRQAPASSRLPSTTSSVAGLSTNKSSTQNIDSTTPLAGRPPPESSTGPSRAAPQSASHALAIGRDSGSTAPAKPQTNIQPSSNSSSGPRLPSTSAVPQQPSSLQPASRAGAVAELQARLERDVDHDREWALRKELNNPRSTQPGALSVEALYKQAIYRQGLRPYIYDSITEDILRPLRRLSAYPVMPPIDPVQGKIPSWQKQQAYDQMERHGISIPRNHPDHPFNW